METEKKEEKAPAAGKYKLDVSGGAFGNLNGGGGGFGNMSFIRTPRQGKASDGPPAAPASSTRTRPLPKMDRLPIEHIMSGQFGGGAPKPAPPAENVDRWVADD